MVRDVAESTGRKSGGLQSREGGVHMEHDRRLALYESCPLKKACSPKEVIYQSSNFDCAQHIDNFA